MPFYSNDNDGTPCPVRSRSPNSDLWNRQQGDRTTLASLTTFPLISGDDHDETIEIDLTTALPNIKSLTGRRNTILNEPPRRPGQVSRPRDETLQSEKNKEKLGEDFFTLPSSTPLPLPQQLPASEGEPIYLPEVVATLQSQSAQLQAKGITSGAGLHQPRRLVTGPSKGGRRLSAWIEAKVQEKRRKRIAVQNENEPVQQSISTERYIEKVTGSQAFNGVKLQQSPEETELAKAYLNAPPKRRTSRPTGKVLSHITGKGVAKGKENILPELDTQREEMGQINSMISSRQVLKDQSEWKDLRGHKRPASTENGVNKRLKFSLELEHKTSAHGQRPHSYPSSNSNIPGNEQPTSGKRPSSPQPRFVSESDLEEDSYPSISNSLIRSSHTSSQPWKQEPSKDRKLRLIKRKKISDDANEHEASLNPAQEALSQQLQALRRTEKSQKNGPISSMPGSSLDNLDTMNPVLSDNLTQVRLYEDSWLSMLEASVTQLVNAIFSTYEASQASTIETHLQLRREMISLYSTLPTLHKRVQASLTFGALTVPRSSLTKTPVAKTWGEDIGLKKKFMDLFMNTYEVEVLGIALEVIIGRELFGKSGPRLSDAQIIEEGTYILSMQEKDKVKLVESFLERFLVNCEDAYLNQPQPHQSTARILGALGISRIKGSALGRSAAFEDDWGTVAWGLRKTVLRALMLIILMDKVKTEKNLLGCRCLFKQNSPHKSSVSILHTLSRLLLPSLGDIIRPLSLMGYTVDYVQHSLEEYSYTVENIAVDMRDGVRLVRLAELLLYPTEAQTSKQTGAWPLSKELRFPATSRAHKLKNVAIALEALEDAGGNENQVKPEDIVDGYREGTIGLLWGIVGRWGLEMGVGGLVDWSELRKEIRNLKKHWILPEGGGLKLEEAEDEEEGEERGYVALLKSWARCIAARKGLLVENMTTSFADGRVFKAIVEQYEGYFPKKIINSQEVGLKVRLRQLGCSSYFASLFSEKAGKVFDKDFVIGALAFLCSRLLQWSIRERAAVNIQRVFRAWKFRQTAHMRLHFLILAYECAAVVQFKEKVIRAVIIIQRAFRKHLRTKLDRFINAIIGIQCTIRGCLIRQDIFLLTKVTVKMQRWWRILREKRFRQRTRMILENLTKLQAVARRFLERRRIDDIYYAVAIVGIEYGRLLKGRRDRMEFHKQREAAIRIQRWYRSVMEMRLDRKRYLEIRSAIVQLQAFLRGKNVRDNCNAKIHAAVVIQRHIRSCIQISRVQYYFTSVLWAAMVVQSRRRETLKARKMRRDYLLVRAYAITIQRKFRERKAINNAALILQRAWRKYNWVVWTRKTLREVVLIQSLWRGFIARKCTIPRLRILRRKIFKAMQAGTGGEESLRTRTLNGITKVKAATGLGWGLVQLEYTTKNSHECSALLAADENALKVLICQVESATKQLQKRNSVTPTRNILHIFNILLNISSSREAGGIIACRPISKGGDILSVVFSYLGASAKQPVAPTELFLTAVSILKNFCIISPELRQKFTQNQNSLDVLTSIARAERETRNVVGTRGKRAVDACDHGGFRARKIEELLGLLQ